MQFEISNITVKISTITGYFNNAFPTCNIVNIGKYIEIDKELIGLRYKRANSIITKGIYTNSIKNTNNGFNNQISLVVYYNKKKYNVKLFKNGSMQITGCKKIEDINEIKTIIAEKIEKFKNKYDTILLSKDCESDNYIDVNNLLYNDSYEIIGYKDDCRYVLTPLNTGIQNEYIYDKNINKFIIDTKTSKYKKNIVNNNGIQVGYKHINMNRYRKRTYNKNIVIEDNIIFHNNEVVGKVEYVYEDNIQEEEKEKYNYIEIEYACNPYKSIKLEEEYITTYINIVFDIKYNINIENVLKKLRELRYIVLYNPTSYSAIKLIYKKNKDDNGLCNCISKCICKKLTYMIFKSGKIIGSGFENYEDITTNSKKIISIFQNNKESMQ